MASHDQPGFSGFSGFFRPLSRVRVHARVRAYARGAIGPEKPEKPEKPGGHTMTRVHLVSTTATEQPCPRCRRATLTALDEGLPARVDATPLHDRTAEIAALLQGRWTFTYTANRQLIHRDATRITDNHLRGTVHAAHKCVGYEQTTIDDMIGD